MFIKKTLDDVDRVGCDDGDVKGDVGVVKQSIGDNVGSVGDRA